jgi:hypothetical protein
LREELRRVIDADPSRPAPRLRLDLACCTCIDVDGLLALSVAQHAARLRGGDLHLAHVPSLIARQVRPRAAIGGQRPLGSQRRQFDRALGHLAPGGLPSGEVPEDEPEGDSAAVEALGWRPTGVAGGVQPGDDLVRCVQRPPVRIGARAADGTESARLDLGA